MVRRRKRNVSEEKISHFLVPRHELVKEEDEKEILDKFGVTKDQLPRINEYDPALRGLGVKRGDLIKIFREEETGKNAYYRVVVK